MAPIVSPPAGVHPGAGRHHQGRALLTVNLPAPSPGVGLPVLSPLSFGATFQAGGTLEGGALERRLSHLGRFHTGRASYRDVLLAPADSAAAAVSMESFALPVDRPPVREQPRPPCQLRSVIVGTIRSEVHHGRLASRGPDADGFQMV